MYGQAIGDAIFRGIIIVAVVAFGLGALAVWGLPKVWELVKPFIHSLTA